MKSVDGQGAIYHRKKKNNNDFIQEILRKVDNGILSLHDALNQFTSPSNKFFNNNNSIFTTNSDNIEDKDNDNDKDEDKDNDVNNLNNIASNSHSDRFLCVVCCEHPRSILLLPCNHYKLCSGCCEKIREGYIKKNNGPVLCLICRSIVQGTSKIYA